MPHRFRQHIRRINHQHHGAHMLIFEFSGCIQERYFALDEGCYRFDRTVRKFLLLRFFAQNHLLIPESQLHHPKHQALVSRPYILTHNYDVMVGFHKRKYRRRSDRDSLALESSNISSPRPASILQLYFR